MKRSSYRPDEIAKLIANGHAANKHFSCDEILTVEKNIELTLLDKDSIVFRTHKKKDLYYNEKSNLFVSVDLKNKHGGTCFTPDNGEYYKRQIAKEINKRTEINDKKHKGIGANRYKRMPDLNVRKGGYSALYESKKLDKSLRYKLEKEAERKRINEEFKKKQKKPKQERKVETKDAKRFDQLFKKEKQYKTTQQNRHLKSFIKEEKSIVEQTVKEKREALARKLEENKKEIAKKNETLDKLKEIEKRKKVLARNKETNELSVLDKLQQKEKEIAARKEALAKASELNVLAKLQQKEKEIEERNRIREEERRKLDKEKEAERIKQQSRTK